YPHAPPNGENGRKEGYPHAPPIGENSGREGYLHTPPNGENGEREGYPHAPPIGENSGKEGYLCTTSTRVFSKRAESLYRLNSGFCQKGGIFFTTQISFSSNDEEFPHRPILIFIE
ncbi:hypothetical protein, partial [Kallipyga massiliensis]|uniref:hypothetical protein n=1 Tax=Kallipyga massiliensis TaxID=1472764 RepID=UPI0026EA1E2E